MEGDLSRRIVPSGAATVIAVFALVGCSSTSERTSSPGIALGSKEPDVPQVPLRALEPAEDYRLGSPDRLELQIFELEKPGTLTKLEVEVSAIGDITVPFAGKIPARGKTIHELETDVAKGLSRVILNPQLTLLVKSYQSHQIAVMGAVDKPGVFYLNRNRVTLIEALSLPGGLSKEKEAGTRVVVFGPKISPGIYDPSQAVASSVPYREIDLVRLLTGRDPTLDIWVDPGSTIVVPQAEEYFVQGYVNKAGAFAYKRPTTVIQAISTAGGFDERRGSRSCVTIKRPARGGLSIIDVDASAIANGDEPDVAIYPGDAIEVGRTPAWAVYSEFLEGFKGLVGFGVSAGTIK